MSRPPIIGLLFGTSVGIAALFSSAAIAEGAPSDAEYESMIAELAAAPGMRLLGDAWSVAVPGTGRWSVLSLAGTQQNCLALQALPDAVVVAATMTACPQSTPQTVDPVETTLSMAIQDVESTASSEGYRIAERRRGSDVLPGIRVPAFAYRSGKLRHIPGAHAFGFRAVRCQTVGRPVCLLFASDGVAVARRDEVARALAEWVDSLVWGPTDE